MFCETKEVLEEEKYRTYKVAQVGTDVLFYSTYDGRHCKYSITDNTIHLLEDGLLTHRLTEPVEFYSCINGLLILICEHGKKCEWRDLSTGAVDYTYLDTETTGWCDYSVITIYNGCIHIFTRHTNQWIVIDINSKKVRKKEINAKKRIDINRGCIADNCAFLFSADGQEIYRCDLVNENVNCEKIADNKQVVMQAMYHEGRIFIMLITGAIYNMDPNTYIIKEEVNETNHGCMGMFAILNDYYLELPATGEDILLIDKKSKRIKELKNYPEDFFYFQSDNYLKYSDSFENNNCIYFPMRKANYLLAVDKTSADIKWIKPLLPKRDEECSYISSWIKKNNNIYGPEMSLAEYINGVKYING